MRIVEKKVPKGRIKINRTVRWFAGRFRRPLEDPAIAVIFISCREELRQVVAIRDLLFGVPLVLILPDNDRDTVADAHSLRPRFLAYTYSDVREICAVLSRMIDKAGTKYGYRERAKAELSRNAG